MKKTQIALCTLYGVLYAAVANAYVAVAADLRLLYGVLPLFVLINGLAGVFAVKTRRWRIREVHHGAVLLTAFLISTGVSVVVHTVLAFRLIPEDWRTLLWSAVYCIAAEAILFWNGILCVYAASLQLGIKQRVIGAICGFIPVANLIVLVRILRICLREVDTETAKERVNRARQADRVCATRYPLLLVHGVFFRDTRAFNYWGRIPRELKQNGATVHYGNHGSAASVADSAAELARRIREIVAQTGCEKVNIIAHSKGGLDCRYALAHLDVAPYVASLTTINTPHRGCLFADYLLTKVSPDLQNKVAGAYNGALKRLGDTEPDFLAAVNNLTAAFCTQFDEDTPAPEGVYCRSVGSLLGRARNGTFPLNFSYHLVKLFDGSNDGLVSEASFKWGEDYTLLASPGDEGISHGDMIDLNRRDVEGFDVREFYVGLVRDLKEKGL